MNDRAAARALLGVGEADDEATIRSAYRRLVRRHHPDVDAATDAGSTTAALTAAYRLLLRTDDGSVAPPTRAGDDGASAGDPPVRLVADDTLALDLPGEEAFMVLLEVLHDLGEVTAVDDASGLVDTLVHFDDGGRVSLLVTLQGRAAGGTEVFCTLERLDGAPAPPIAPVVDALLERLRDAFEA